jgi:hypothetical protein
MKTPPAAKTEVRQSPPPTNNKKEPQAMDDDLKEFMRDEDEVKPKKPMKDMGDEDEFKEDEFKIEEDISTVENFPEDDDEDDF